MESSTLPTPLAPLPADVQDKRLWIGNLDTRLNEYQLIKILQRFGRIEKFDLLFHRSGPLEGQPRGYAFVTYKESHEAIEAKTKLHGKKLGSKQVAVKWAHTFNADEWDKTKQMPDIPALAGAKKESLKATTSTIQAIEAKLRLMENTPSANLDFTERPTLVTQLARSSSNVGLNKGPHRGNREIAQNRGLYRGNRDRIASRRKAHPYQRSKWR